MTKKIVLSIVLASLATVASAGTTPSCTQSPPSFFSELLSLFSPVKTSCGSGGSTGAVSAPEIDPASAMAGLSLMGAGLAILRGRRKSK